jgi:hypothetical protein
MTNTTNNSVSHLVGCGKGVISYVGEAAGPSHPKVGRDALVCREGRYRLQKGKLSSEGRGAVVSRQVPFSSAGRDALVCRDGRFRLKARMLSSAGRDALVCREGRFRLKARTLSSAGRDALVCREGRFRLKTRALSYAGRGPFRLQAGTLSSEGTDAVVKAGTLVCRQGRS